MLVSDVRLYHVVAKVTTHYGAERPGALKGGVIYFPHDGPKEAAKALAGELAKRSAKDGRKRRRGTGAASARKKQAAPAARSPVDASDGEGHEQMRDASDAQDDGASMSEGE